MLHLQATKRMMQAKTDDALEVAMRRNKFLCDHRNAEAMMKTVLIFLALALSVPATRADDTFNLFENLVPVENAQMGMAYIDPNADFSVFRRVKILDTFVAFRSGWERDQRRTASRMRITANDMERIKADTAALFKQVFAERLAADDGFEVVDEVGEDVLLLRPAIIDLDITAPDTPSTGRTRTFTSSSGAATLYLELYDSISGQILGRAADRQVVRGTGGTVSWSSRVTNTADATRMFGAWADTLRAFLESHYVK